MIWYIRVFECSSFDELCSDCVSSEAIKKACDISSGSQKTYILSYVTKSGKSKTYGILKDGKFLFI